MFKYHIATIVNISNKIAIKYGSCYWNTKLDDFICWMSIKQYYIILNLSMVKIENYDFLNHDSRIQAKLMIFYIRNVYDIGHFIYK